MTNKKKHKKNNSKVFGTFQSGTCVILGVEQKLGDAITEFQLVKTGLRSASF